MATTPNGKTQEPLKYDQVGQLQYEVENQASNIGEATDPIYLALKDGRPITDEMIATIKIEITLERTFLDSLEQLVNSLRNSQER